MGATKFLTLTFLLLESTLISCKNSEKLRFDVAKDSIGYSTDHYATAFSTVIDCSAGNVTLTHSCDPASSCYLTLTSDQDQRVVLDFDFDPHDSNGALYLLDGNADAPLLASFAYGGEQISPIRSTGSNLTVYLSSNVDFRGNCSQEPAAAGSSAAQCATRYFYGNESGVITASDFSSENWTLCTYLIKAPVANEEGQEIALEFQRMNISGSTADSNIQVGESGGVLGEYSGASPIPSVVAQSNFMNITVQRPTLTDPVAFDYSLSYGRTAGACNCSNHTGTHSVSTRLHLPNYPAQQYCNNMYCSYKLEVDDGCFVRFMIVRLTLASGDYLAFYDKGQLLRKYDGPQDVQGYTEFVSESTFVKVIFHSDSDYVADGFDIAYEAYCGLTVTNIVGLAMGLIVLLILFGGVMCYCVSKYRQRTSVPVLLSNRSRIMPRSRRGHVVEVTGPNGETILELPDVISLPSYNDALALPVFEEPPRLSAEIEDNPPEPPPPAYSTLIKDEDDQEEEVIGGPRMLLVDLSSSSAANTPNGTSDRDNVIEAELSV